MYLQAFSRCVRSRPLQTKHLQTSWVSLFFCALMSCQAFCSFSVTFAALCFHTVGVTMQQRFIPLPRGGSEFLVPSKKIGCDLNKLSSVLQAFHNQTWQLWGCAVAVCTTMTCIWVCSCLLLFWVADVVTCSCQCSTCSIGAPVMSTFLIWTNHIPRLSFSVLFIYGISSPRRQL